MTEAEEAAYVRGNLAVYRELLGVALRGLHLEPMPDDLEGMRKRVGALESELHDARAQLRILCEDFGDNDWEEQDHLADVIDKHLGRHLHERAVDDEDASE
jgi:hypothetical protein